MEMGNELVRLRLEPAVQPSIGLGVQIPILALSEACAWPRSMVIIDFVACVASESVSFSERLP
jgi:hypothetical protein